MKENILQDSAFPMAFKESFEAQLNSKQNPWGMSKRFYAACAAMQGMLANSNYKDSDFNNNKESMISLCYVAADELLEQENL